MSEVSTARISKDWLIVWVLIIFYTVGIVGLSVDTLKEQFLSLSFFNLLLSFGLALLSFRNWNSRIAICLVIFFLSGMIVEWIGTQTGWLFGDYYYGANLGPKIAGVPWVIGINWALLICCSASIAAKIQANPFVRAIVGASLMTVLDVLMEPVAIKSDYWHWSSATIPMYNYICWFVIAFLLQLGYFSFVKIESNKVLDSLFFLMFVFFVILNFT
jgi:putative membrane protein